jgi:restriction endonuclease S subunit
MSECERSYFYGLSFERISDRLDYIYNHPRFDKIKAFRSSQVSFRFSELAIPNGVDYGITESGKDEGRIEFVNTQNLNEHGVIEREDIKFVDSAPDNKRLSANEILISRSRLVGRVAKVTDDFEGATFGSYIIRFKLRDNIDYDLDFLVRYLNGKSGQEQIELLKTGSSGQNINSGQLLDIRLPRISDTKQQVILKTISAVESEATTFERDLEILEKKIETMLLEEIGIRVTEAERENYFFKSGNRKTVFFSVFPDEQMDRLSYLFYDPRYDILQELRRKYDVDALKNACCEPIHRGEQPEYSENGEILAIKTIDLKSSYIDYDHCLRVSKEFFDKVPTAHVRKNDVLVASTGYGSMGKVDVYSKNEEAMVDGHIAILRLKEEYDPFFIAYFLRSHLGQIQFEKWFTGSSGQIEIQPKDLDQFILPKSSDTGLSLTRQKGIASKLTEILNDCFELKEKSKEKWEQSKNLFEKLIWQQITNQPSEENK